MGMFSFLTWFFGRDDIEDKDKLDAYIKDRIEEEACR